MSQSQPSQVPSAIEALVARFREHHDEYRKGRYNETQLRREFIDPFFKALGWDVDNEQGFAEAYKDVIHEDAIKIDGATKAPDYCFRLGKEKKFFVEAKRPSVDIKGAPGPAYQLRRYAWSAKLPLSILTDFDEFAVYDCRIRPFPNDKAAKARVIYLRFEEYIEPEKWAQIASIFSRTAIPRGSFDKFAESSTDKHGTQTVDEAFLQEINSWREALARNIALRQNISQRQLNFAVQLTIDRIVFLRICEDRSIEPYGGLLALTNGRDIYGRLFEKFRRADARYNSGLFHFSKEKDREEAPDDLTPTLTVDDKVLKEIIVGLYFPTSPYQFSEIPADILGQVYEQFLGKVIRLTEGHRAVVDEKPEVLKVGGVYYTPTYIVDYIVRSTVARLLKGKTPQEVGGLTETWQLSKARDRRPLSILDPACGSGSFLLVAYQALLDWYRDSYIETDPKKHAVGKSPRLYQRASGEWALTTGERKRILLSHIFGVDIDSQAVEVTKLSLLLKVLEGENDQTLGTQLRLFQERALPDLSSNIKCGNSLVAPDLYKELQLLLLDEDKRLSINPFDWKAEFATIMQSGGFDAVIGNPPYIDSEWMTSFLPEVRSYCGPRYAAASGNWDMFCVFSEKALNLTKAGGYHSFIVPNKLGSANYASEARRLLATENEIDTIADYSHVRVFRVSVYPIVYVVRRRDGKSTAQETTPSVKYERFGKNPDSGMIECTERRELEYSKYFSTPKTPWTIFAKGGATNVVERLGSFPKLSEFAEVLGAATVSEAYEIEKLVTECSQDYGDGVRLVNSGTIDRYCNLWGIKPCRYLGKKMMFPAIPGTRAHLLPKKRLQQAKTPKVIIAGMTKCLEATCDFAGNFLAGKSTTIIMSRYDLRLLVAILNSKVVDHFYQVVYGGNKLQGGYLRIGPPQVKEIPIPRLDSLDDKVVSGITKLVDELVHAQTAALQARTPHEANAYKRRVDALDEQIEHAVGQLYSLNDQELLEIRSTQPS